MKKIKINLLAVIGMMVAVATVAFTTIEKSAAPEDGWYEVTLADNAPSDSPEFQEIGPKMTAPPPELDPNNCAQTLNEGLTCAIQLTFDEALEVPSTVKDAESDPNTEIEDYANKPEE